ncbi:hypothetical protein FS837_000949 [Tulasnella sp. UAMH 9824]|nr:hypothetical protein FS837_000949 [Tulasnella sp. UAMH 9824]
MLRQLRIWVRLRHEGILQLIGFHIDHLYNEAWLISPWQPNGNLLAYISKHELQFVDRLRLCVQVGEAVKYLHENEPPIFHGDLKASNILITESRTAMLAGFGLAEAMDEFESGLTTSGGLRGSIRWTSPELLTETIPRRSQKSDAWAFGCLLLELQLCVHSSSDAGAESLRTARHWESAGVFYRMRPTKPSIEVAVKKLVSSVDGTKALTVAEGRERWYRDGERWARLWNGLKHSRILPILAFSSKSPPYVLSPWCEYGDLKSYLRVNPPIDTPGKINMVAEGVLALHAHRPPVIHGNIHATNILVYAPGQTYLAGFSQARFLDGPNHHTSSGLTTGADEFSPSYVVPEVAKELPLTQATDVYSFACLILECLSGNPPFYKLARSVAVLKILLYDELPAYTDHPELPDFDPLWQILRKAWDIDPSERPTMEDMVAVLQEREGHNTIATSEIRRPSVENSPIHTNPSPSVGNPGTQAGQEPMDIGQLEGSIVVNDDSPVFRGGFGDVCRGEWTVNGKKRTVAVKSLRPVALNPNESEQGNSAMHNRLDMIVPFFGIQLKDRPILASKWYENGNLGDYVKAHPELPFVRRLDFVR